MPRQEINNRFVLKATRRNGLLKVALGAILFTALCVTAVSQGVARADTPADATVQSVKTAKTVQAVPASTVEPQAKQSRNSWASTRSRASACSSI